MCLHKINKVYSYLTFTSFFDLLPAEVMSADDGKDRLESFFCDLPQRLLQMVRMQAGSRSLDVAYDVNSCTSEQPQLVTSVSTPCAVILARSTFIKMVNRNKDT